MKAGQRTFRSCRGFSVGTDRGPCDVPGASPSFNASAPDEDFHFQNHRYPGGKFQVHHLNATKCAASLYRYAVKTREVSQRKRDLGGRGIAKGTRGSRETWEDNGRASKALRGPPKQTDLRQIRDPWNLKDQSSRGENRRESLRKTREPRRT